MDIEELKYGIDLLISELNSILINFTKAPNRAYSRKFLIRKKKQATNNYKLVNERLAENETKITSTELNFYIKAVRQKFNDILLIVNEKLVNAQDQFTSLRTIALVFLFYIKIKRKAGKMAKVDIKTGTSLIAMYDGAPENLNAFLDAVSLFQDLVNADFAAASQAAKDAAQATIIRFVKTRITGLARQVIAELNDLQEILDAIKNNCGSKVTSDNVVAKLKALKQKDSTESFCNKVEELTVQLRTSYIKEKIPMDRANIMATKVGIETLISGIKNTETKIILKAGQFSKINDAVQKVMENDTTTSATSISTNAQMFWAGRGSKSRGRGGPSFRGRGNQHYHDNRNQFRSGNFNTQPNFNRGSWRQNNRNPHQRGSWNRRGFYAPNMFMAHGNDANNQTQHLQYQPIQQQLQQQLHSQQPNPQTNVHPFLGLQHGQHTQ